VIFGTPALDADDEDLQAVRNEVRGERERMVDPYPRLLLEVAAARASAFGE
jgi:hypothetical protein